MLPCLHKKPKHLIKRMTCKTYSHSSLFFLPWILSSYRLLNIKGAPEVLISRCSSFTDEDGTTRTLDANTRAVIEGIKDDWSSQGKRVLLLARKILPQNVLPFSHSSSDYETEVLKHARSDLTLVGLVGIVDPPVSSPQFAEET